MHALYGTPPDGLVTVPAGAVQCSPLMPGSTALEELGEGAADGFIVHAPRATQDRRYVLAHALRASKTGATLVALAGNKLGGARIGDELRSFGCVVDEAARHHFRVCTVVVPREPAGLAEAIAAGAPRLLPDLGLWSQPGIFSWDRIDPGSALLIEHLPPLTGRGADLGCGIGTLARTVLAQDAVTRLELVDLDRRAIAAACRNLDDARARFHWASVETLTLSGLDFVVMNPPFHDGSTENPDLGRAFIRTAARALRSGGECLLVANRHLPYEAAIKPLFAAVDLLAQRDGFKVYRARK